MRGSDEICDVESPRSAQRSRLPNVPDRRLLRPKEGRRLTEHVVTREMHERETARSKIFEEEPRLQESNRPRELRDRELEAVRFRTAQSSNLGPASDERARRD